MSARDDFGSDAGRSGGRGGSNGGLANGGVGGGRGGGGGGGGAGRNGGYGSQTGLTTGNKMYGNTATGRPGGYARNPGAWGIRPGPSIQQGPLNRPTYPGVMTPVQPPVPPPVPAYYPPNIPRTYVPSKIHQWFDPPTIPNAAYPAYNYFKNPTSFPQWGFGWGKQNDNYFNHSNYPGGYTYTGPDGNWGTVGRRDDGKGDFQGNNFNGNKGYY